MIFQPESLAVSAIRVSQLISCMPNHCSNHWNKMSRLRIRLKIGTYMYLLTYLSIQGDSTTSGTRIIRYTYLKNTLLCTYLLFSSSFVHLSLTGFCAHFSWSKFASFMFWGLPFPKSWHKSVRICKYLSKKVSQSY